MTDERVQELFKKYRETGDTNYRNEIVENYYGLVRAIARRCFHKGGMTTDYDDIYQVGCIGLLDACEKYKLDSNVKFSTYASPTILGHIMNYLRDRNDLVRRPRKLRGFKYKIGAFCDEYYMINGTSPTYSEIAKHFGETEETVIEALEDSSVLSLDASVPMDDSDITFVDAIEDTAVQDEFRRDSIRDAVARLPELERKIIEMRYFDGLSQEAISNLLNISQMSVSRFEKRAKESLLGILNEV